MWNKYFFFNTFKSWRIEKKILLEEGKAEPIRREGIPWQIFAFRNRMKKSGGEFQPSESREGGVELRPDNGAWGRLGLEQWPPGAIIKMTCSAGTGIRREVRCIAYNATTIFACRFSTIHFGLSMDFLFLAENRCRDFKKKLRNLFRVVSPHPPHPVIRSIEVLMMTQRGLIFIFLAVAERRRTFGILF